MYRIFRNELIVLRGLDMLQLQKSSDSSYMKSIDQQPPCNLMKILIYK